MEVELFIVINMNIDCTRVTMLQMNSRTTGCNINGWETWIWTDFLHLIQWFILLTQEFFHPTPQVAQYVAKEKEEERDASGDFCVFL